jgi:tetratricopeptide (TPR) repeat protein
MTRVQFSTFILGLFVATSCATLQPTNSQTTQQQQGRPATKPTTAPKVAAAFNTGNQYARDGLLREAIESYKEALQGDPKNTLISRNLGIVLVKAGDFPNGISNLEKSLENFERNFDANFYLGEAYRATDKYSEAIFRYKRALKIRDNDPKTMKSLAWSYYKIRFYSEALLLSQKALHQNPNDDQVPVIVARVLLKLKRFQEAINVIKKNYERIPASTHPYYQSVEAEIHLAAGRPQDAFNLYKLALKSQPMLAGALMGMGRILLEAGKLTDASDYLERAVRVKPKMYEAHFYLAQSLEQQNPQKALKHYNYFRKNAVADPEFIDLVQSAKERTAKLNTTKPEASNLQVY